MTLPDDLYTVGVTPLNEAGTGPASEWTLFSVGGPTPPAPNLLSPVDVFVNTNQPAYVWEALTATGYLFVLYRMEEPEVLVNWQFLDSATVCSAGTRVPAKLATRRRPLCLGSAGLYFLAQGPWSWGFFSTVTSVPQAPLMIAPNGAIGATYPTYEWENPSAPSSTSFRSKMKRVLLCFKRSFSASSVCDADVCSTPAAVLLQGYYNWTVRGRNSIGSGP
jgi:hypothetical protein